MLQESPPPFTEILKTQMRRIVDDICKHDAVINPFVFPVSKQLDAYSFGLY